MYFQVSTGLYAQLDLTQETTTVKLATQLFCSSRNASTACYSIQRVFLPEMQIHPPQVSMSEAGTTMAHQLRWPFILHAHICITQGKQK